MNYTVKKLLLMCAILTAGSLQGNSQEYHASLLFKAEATTGEGAIWHPGRKSLFWVDIEGKTLYEYRPDKKECKNWLFNRMLSTVVPETDNSVIVALQNEIVRVDLTTGETTSVTPIDDLNGTVRCNDGKCDPEGRLWIGTIVQKAPAGSAILYMVTEDGTVTPRLTGVTNSNGIVWTADKQYLYYIDTPTKQIARYKYKAETGEILFDGIAVTVPEGTGKPDGMTIDENGNLWVGHWGGYGVYCYDPQTGELLTKINVPCPNVPSCAFGGENLDILYITTARKGISEEDLSKYPDSGSLFYYKSEVKGVKANYFAKTQ